MEWGLWGLFVAWCVALCWYDVREHRLPNALTVPGALVACGAACLLGASGDWSGAIGAAIWTLVNGLVFLFGGMGAGDVKLAPSLGVIVGLSGGVPMVLVAITIAAGATAAWAVLARRPAVAHGPAMCLAALTALGLNPP